MGSGKVDFMVAELALSAVAVQIILLFLFLLKVALKSAEESSNVSPSSRSMRVTLIDHARSSAVDCSPHTASRR